MTPALAQACLDAHFAGEPEAEWLQGPDAQPTGTPNCRIMVRREGAGEFGLDGFESRLKTAGYWVSVRVSEIPKLAEGDRFVLAGEIYRVSEAPDRPDDYRLKWMALCAIEGKPGG